MVMKIKVCQTHINKGLCGDHRHCPIALAIKAHPTIKRLKCKSSVMVECRSVDIRWPDDNYKLPIKAMQFIHQFDAGKKVKPFSFEIKLCTNSARFGELP